MAPRTKKAERRPSVSYLTDTLPSALPPIFEQVQGSTATHRKNIVQLFKVQKTCAEVTEETEKGIRLVGERSFNALFINMINRVLPVKKGVAVADRVVKFVASYVAYTTEQGGLSEYVRYLTADTNEEEDGDSMSQRFVAKLVRHLLAGTEAKDKSVRFRVTLMLAWLSSQNTPA
jgi:condensin complex subunit 3